MEIELVETANPEARIDQMIHELAYERVKHSYLFNVLENAEVDAKADELAGLITAQVETWISDEVSAAAQRDADADYASTPHPSAHYERG